ncbi:hypothetical protein PISMIDRAFT_683485 [Pisolithus microcarpus 441]|uniref:Uncharacterized protein n=1 Tax=Pisolithus microcarpus 441 TaxID=765257 RepID=A0A0C9ZGP8_9AGAM|nr:hypothetical protein PISMIDRAFT_683485 [Pisolithus microcarpus 441]
MDAAGPEMQGRRPSSFQITHRKPHGRNPLPQEVTPVRSLERQPSIVDLESLAGKPTLATAESDCEYAESSSTMERPRGCLFSRMS